MSSSIENKLDLVLLNLKELNERITKTENKLDKVDNRLDELENEVKSKVDMIVVANLIGRINELEQFKVNYEKKNLCRKVLAKGWMCLSTA